MVRSLHKCEFERDGKKPIKHHLKITAFLDGPPYTFRSGPKIAIFMVMALVYQVDWTLTQQRGTDNY